MFENIKMKKKIEDITILGTFQKIYFNSENIISGTITEKTKVGFVISSYIKGIYESCCRVDFLYEDVTIVNGKLMISTLPFQLEVKNICETLEQTMLCEFDEFEDDEKVRFYKSVMYLMNLQSLQMYESRMDLVRNEKTIIEIISDLVDCMLSYELQEEFKDLE